MNRSDSIGHKEYLILQDQCDEIAKEEGIHLALLVHSTGQIIVSSGQKSAAELTSLGALFAGSIASASGISKIFNEPAFSSLILEGQKEQVFAYSLPQKGILIVHFDKMRALGWVRFMVRKRMHIITEQLQSLKEQYARVKSPMSGVSEEEIDNLNFGGF